MELYPFDEEYLMRLRAHDPATETHFFQYFHDLLKRKLRARTYSDDASNEIRQETLNRSLACVYIRKIKNPGRLLHPLVFSICSSVEMERKRRSP